MCFIVFSSCEEAINFSTGFCRLFVGFLLNAKVVRSLVVKSYTWLDLKVVDHGGTSYRYYMVTD